MSKTIAGLKMYDYRVDVEEKITILAVMLTYGPTNKAKIVAYDDEEYLSSMERTILAVKGCKFQFMKRWETITRVLGDS